ncbi:MAG: hypothetical protein R3B90_20015 [Planctomycetaceae bacterium]
MSQRLRWRIRWRLSVLWFLEWGITGSLLTYLPLYFTSHGLPLEDRAAAGDWAVGLWWRRSSPGRFAIGG